MALKKKKVRRDAKLKNLDPDDQETLWLLLNPTDSTVPAYTPEAALVYIQEEHGFSVVSSTLWEWQSWYALNGRMDAAAERAEQAKLRYAELNPKAALDELEAFGQYIFTSETMQDKDVLNFGRLRKLRLQERAAEQKDQVIALKDREVRQKDEVIAQNERRIVMLEAKAAKADQADQVMGDGKLTEEEKAAKLKQIFRMG